MPDRLMLRRAARPKTPCVVSRSISASMATSAGSETFFLPATSLIAERKHADQPAANRLLGVGAGTRAARRRKLDVEPAIVAVGDAAVPTTRGVRFRGVQDFFAGHDSLLVKQVSYESSNGNRFPPDSMCCD